MYNGFLVMVSTTFFLQQTAVPMISIGMEEPPQEDVQEDDDTDSFPDLAWES